MSRYEARHRAPGRHKSRRYSLTAPPPWAKTFAAVTSASLGVTGAVAGGAYVSGGFSEPGDLQLMTDPQIGAASAQIRAATITGESIRAGAESRASRSEAERSTTTAAGSRAQDPATQTEKKTVKEPESAVYESVLDRTAVEKRRADELAAEEARKAAQLASGDPREIARALVADRGWGEDQFSCLDSLWNRESGWRTTAQNPSSGAYGIPQALPGSKMATFGDDWQTNPATQIKWGLHYIDGRYGSPCGAWAHSQSVGWY